MHRHSHITLASSIQLQSSDHLPCNDPKDEKDELFIEDHQREVKKQKDYGSTQEESGSDEEEDDKEEACSDLKRKSDSESAPELDLMSEESEGEVHVSNVLLEEQLHSQCIPEDKSINTPKNKEKPKKFTNKQISEKNRENIKQKIPLFIAPVVLLHCKRCNLPSEIMSNTQKLLTLLWPGPGDSSYEFICKKCTGSEVQLEHKQKTWTEIALTAMYNLELLHQRQFFHSKFEVCQFVDDHWDTLCVGKTRTLTWWATLHAQITQNKHLFKTISYGSGYWGITHDTRDSTQLDAVRQYKDKVKWEVTAGGTDAKQLDKKFLRKRKSKDSKKTSYLKSSTSFQQEQLYKEKRTNCDIIDSNIICHQCRHRITSNTVYSCHNASLCTKSYCQSCIQDIYQIDLTMVQSISWICPHCLGICEGRWCKVKSDIQDEDVQKSKQGIPIQRIVAKATKQNLTQYLVQFFGYPLSSCMWMPLSQTQNEQSDFVQAIMQFNNCSKICLKKESLKCINMKLRKVDLDTPTKITPLKKKKRRYSEGRRNSDFDLNKIITYGQPYISVIKPKPQVVLTPSFREITESENGCETLEAKKHALSERESSSDEDTDDEHYELLHRTQVLAFERGLYTLGEKKKKQRMKQQQEADKTIQQMAKNIEGKKGTSNEGITC